MTKKAKIYRNDIYSGVLTKEKNDSYIFRYTDLYFNNPEQPAISLSFPKLKQQYKSNYLFPFFFNMLSEGVNKQLQCRQLKIDEKDYFSLLIATAGNDTIGAITIELIKEELNGLL